MMNRKKDIDNNIWVIQRSTRTSFSSFLRLHNYLRTKSKIYYFWHANRVSSILHQTLLAVFVIGVTYWTFNSYQQYVKAANKSKEIAQDVATMEQRVAQNKVSPISEDILSQISQITANQAVSAFSSELKEIYSLSDKQAYLLVQEDIKQAVAKDNTLLELIKILENGGKLQNEQMSNLITTLSKIGQDSMLSIVNDNLTSANGQLGEIEKRLENTLKVVVSNEKESIAVTNFPQDYPSSSFSNSQEDIGGNFFNRSQDFEQWALKHNYYKYLLSKEINIPKSGESIDAHVLEAPQGHTYYLLDMTVSLQSDKYAKIEIDYKQNQSSDAVSVNQLFISDTKSEKFEQKVKLSPNSSIQIIVKGINKPNGSVLISLTYIDLPWEE